jgi:phage shock protein A
MSALSDALQGIKQVLLLQEQVRRLETAGERQSAALDRLADDLIALDKRVIRIETMIEMTTRQSNQQRIS